MAQSRQTGHWIFWYFAWCLIILALNNKRNDKSGLFKINNMGLLNRNNNKAASMEGTDALLGQAQELLEEPEIRLQLMAMATFMACIAALRLLTNRRLKALEGEHVVNLHRLNDAICYKEVFLAYLNAAMIEPVLAIAGMEEVVGQELLINIFVLGSIFWWIWMVTDAFDYADIMQHFTYHVGIQEEVDEQKRKIPWLRLGSIADDAITERQSLVGSFQKDVALWFVLACIGAAWLPGMVTHRDVMHAYVVVLLWAILHHYCRKTTSWTRGYLVTFLFPSAALMPIEYCLPLQDTFDCVEDLEFVESYRGYVAERTGVELVIVS